MKKWSGKTSVDKLQQVPFSTGLGWCQHCEHPSDYRVAWKVTRNYNGVRSFMEEWRTVWLHAWSTPGEEESLGKQTCLTEDAKVCAWGAPWVSKEAQPKARPLLLHCVIPLISVHSQWSSVSLSCISRAGLYFGRGLVTLPAVLPGCPYQLQLWDPKSLHSGPVIPGTEHRSAGKTRDIQHRISPAIYCLSKKSLVTGCCYLQQKAAVERKHQG